MGGVSGQMGLGATPSLSSSPKGAVPPASSAGSLDGWWDPCLLARAPQGAPASRSSQQTAALSYLGPLLSILKAPDRPLLALSLSLERPPHPHISGGPPRTQQETMCVCFYFKGMEHRPVPTLGEGIATWIQKLENEMALPQHSLRPCVYLYVQMLTHTHTLTWHT